MHYRKSFNLRSLLDSHLQFYLLLLLLGMSMIFSSGEVKAQGSVYVNRNATGANNGTSWADAYTDLQTALANTTAGEIWVAQGTYTPAPPNGDRGASFVLPGGVALYGGFVGHETARDQRDPAAHPTILSGDLNGDDLPNWGNSNDNSYRVVKAINTAAGTVLDGFTIRDGYGAGGFGAIGNDYGAGILVQNGSLTLANCKIVENLATFGGGMEILNGTVTISACEFRDNYAAHYYGGGIANGPGSTTVVSDALFVHNQANGYSAGLSGGAIANSGTMTVTRSTFVNNASLLTMGGNTPGASGGAISSLGVLTVQHSLFVGNLANNGGALGLYGSAAVVNSVFSGNRAVGAQTPWTVGYGGAVALLSPVTQTVTLTGVTISRNTAVEDAGGIYAGSGPLLIENSILWNNTSNNTRLGVFQAQIHGSATLRYNDIQGLSVGIPGEDPPNCTACLDADPLFVNASGADGVVGTPDDNLRLSAGSPVIDAGNNAGFTGITTDADGNARFADDPNTPDTGQGTPPIADMGAYEFAGTSPTATATPTAIPTATPMPTTTPDACSGAPNTPTLRRPRNGATLNQRRVLLDWDDASCATHYKVIVKQNAVNGKRVDGRADLTVSQYRTKALKKGKTYFWQVRACNTNGCSAWSTWWQFAIVQ